MHEFKYEEACLRMRDLPSCFDGGELVIFRSRIRLVSATRRGGSSCQASQLREDL